MRIYKQRKIKPIEQASSSPTGFCKNLHPTGSIFTKKLACSIYLILRMFINSQKQKK